MSSIGAGKVTPIFLAQEMKDGKYYCSFKGVHGVFHTLPRQSELSKIEKIMSKYKCNSIQWEK